MNRQTAGPNAIKQSNPVIYTGLAVFLIAVAGVCIALSAPSYTMREPAYKNGSSTLPGLPALAALPALSPEWQLDSLANGMQIFVLTNKRVPVVTHMVWYKVGSADEPKGKSGIAHYFEHLMFKGTPSVPPGVFSKRVAALGGSDNAFTSYDYTAYFQRIAADQLETVMSMEADRMRNLVLSEELILAERDVVLEERSIRTDTNPAALLDESMNKALYGDHPYGIPVIGWREEIEALSLADAEAFYDRFYAPDNAILVVVGDTDMTEVKRLAERHYGPIPAQNRQRDARSKIEKLKQPIRLERRDPRTLQTQWSRYYQLFLPTDKTRRAKDIAALDVLMEILSSGTLGRLYETLVEDDQLATHVSAYADTEGVDDGYISLRVTPHNTSSIAEIENTLAQTLDRLRQEPVTAAELQRAKTTLLSDYIYAQDSQYLMARIFGTALVYGHQPDYIEAWIRSVEAVTDADVMRAAQTYLDLNLSVTGVLRPKESSP